LRQMLHVSRERPRSRCTDNSYNVIARPSLALGLETTATLAFNQEELQQRFMIGETRFEESIVAKWMSASRPIPDSCTAARKSYSITWPARANFDAARSVADLSGIGSTPMRLNMTESGIRSMVDFGLGDSVSAVRRLAFCKMATLKFRLSTMRSLTSSRSRGPYPRQDGRHA
jgi:hypothetical protein